MSISTKEELIDEMVRNPTDFSTKKLNQLLGIVEQKVSTTVDSEGPQSFSFIPKTKLANIPSTQEELITHKDLVRIVRRIFDLNENAELGQANKGLMGFFNKRSNKKKSQKIL